MGPIANLQVRCRTPASPVTRGTPPWDSERYLRFEAERTLPCRDLVGRIELDAPARIVDLGCGPGTSTAVLAHRWPASSLVGVDHSPEMLDRARALPLSVEWVRADLGEWAPNAPFDLVFSNATLHWLPDHRAVIPRLWRWVAPGGALAFQVPVRGGPMVGWVRAIERTLAREPWRSLTWIDVAGANVVPLETYYDLLSGDARRLDLWDTEYVHVLAGAPEIVEWIRGTALRPLVAQLPGEEERRRFLGELTEEIGRAYEARPDRNVLFPFLRRFVVAYR